MRNALLGAAVRGDAERPRRQAGGARALPGQAADRQFLGALVRPLPGEIPELIKFRKAHKGKLEVLGIGIEDKADAAKEFAKAYDMDYPVFVAKDTGHPADAGARQHQGRPALHAFIDRNGQVVQKKMGIMKKADLDAAAELALKGR
jgi:hypothetical protein